MPNPNRRRRNDRGRFVSLPPAELAPTPPPPSSNDSLAEILGRWGPPLPMGMLRPDPDTGVFVPFGTDPATIGDALGTLVEKIQAFAETMEATARIFAEARARLVIVFEDLAGNTALSLRDLAQRARTARARRDLDRHANETVRRARDDPDGFGAILPVARDLTDVERRELAERAARIARGMDDDADETRPLSRIVTAADLRTAVGEFLVGRVMVGPDAEARVIAADLREYIATRLPVGISCENLHASWAPTTDPRLRFVVELTFPPAEGLRARRHEIHEIIAASTTECVSAPWRVEFAFDDGDRGFAETVGPEAIAVQTPPTVEMAITGNVSSGSEPLGADREGNDEAPPPRTRRRRDRAADQFGRDVRAAIEDNRRERSE